MYVRIHSSIDWHWGSFQFGAVTNGAAEDTWYIPFAAGISGGCVPRSAAAGSLHLPMGSSDFSLLFHFVIPTPTYVEPSPFAWHSLDRLDPDLPLQKLIIYCMGRHTKGQLPVFVSNVTVTQVYPSYMYCLQCLVL